ncbi:MAG: hypothetical protein U0414_30730 [Polyangiaceae bacterium]
MTECKTHLIGIIRATRESLVQSSTDIAYASDEVPLPRPAVEQMLRACVAIVEEGLVGESQEVRAGFLEALPDVARSSTWDATLRGGLPCWGVLLGQLVARAEPAHRAEAITWLSTFMGAWWADVSKVMLPVLIAEKRL